MAEFHLDASTDAELRGDIDPADRERLHAHVAGCPVCRVERALRTAGEPSAGDEERLEAIFDGLELAAAPDVPAAAPPRRPRSVAVLAVAAVSLVGLTAFASWAVWSAPTEEPAPRSEAVAPPAAAEPVTPRPSVEPRAAEPEPEIGTPPVAGTSELAGAQVDPSEVPAAEMPVRDPAELFARANEARRGGRAREAARLYRAVIAREPVSDRANVARVSLGRLALGSLGRPREALRHFETYLSREESGPLAEEALVGRARALGRLRRRGDADAWRALLERFPRSIHASAGRRRLEELERAP